VGRLRSRVTRQPAGDPRSGRIPEVAAGQPAWTRTRRGRRSRYLLYGQRPEPRPADQALTRALPPPGAQRIGICCSGGGVRSAAFNLGALQALQERGELKRATCLSAVSGGSYIAAAFAMVAKSWDPENPPQPAKTDDSDPRLLADLPPFAPGSPEVQYLRNRCSYLAPDGMARLYLGYRLLLGFAFNVFFLSLPVFGVVALTGIYAYHSSFSTSGNPPSEHWHFGAAAWLWRFPALILALSVLAGVVVLIGPPKNDRRARAWQTWFVRLALLAAFVALFTLVLPELVVWATRSRTLSQASSPTARGTGSGAIGGTAGLAGLIAGVIATVRSALAPSTIDATAGRALSWFAKLGHRLRILLAYAAATVAGPAYFLGLMVVVLSLALHRTALHPTDLWLPLGALASLALFGILYARADLTAWSLHPFYKRRLCTAFALKRVANHPPAGEGAPASVAVERRYDRLVRLSDTALRGNPQTSRATGAAGSAAGEDWPELIVCAAANVSDLGATPPGRHVTSFTFSAGTIGGPLVGRVDTDRFEQAFVSRDTRRDARAQTRLGNPEPARSRNADRNLTLPAAVAISGAAISPSMGKLTQPPLRFLLALANVRLGVWLPNPRRVQALIDDQDDPTNPSQLKRYGRPRPSYLLRELIGRNRLTSRYLYVTDGGHYENLGLVELLRRGCTEIYCFDAGAGPSCSALGEAVALARSELGVETAIDLSDLEVDPDTNTARAAAARGRFTYPAWATGAPIGPSGRAEPIRGELVYVRSLMTDDAPVDVKLHRAEDPTFPHDPTADQLFTDQKFESYRALGYCAATQGLAQMDRARWLRRPPFAG
jgi:patatin-like phospholipase